MFAYSRLFDNSKENSMNSKLEGGKIAREFVTKKRLTLNQDLLIVCIRERYLAMTMTSCHIDFSNHHSYHFPMQNLAITVSFPPSTDFLMDLRGPVGGVIFL